MNKKVTIYTIAEEAGVSSATVSRYLTGKASISQGKKAKIEQAIEKYHFIPNQAARRLVTKQTKTLGFIMPDVTHPFYGSAFLEAEKTALFKGYTILLMNTLNDNLQTPKQIESQYIDMIYNQPVDGLLIMGGHIDDLELENSYHERLQALSERMPVVVVNNNIIDIQCHRVMVDEKPGIDALVDYLVALGHREIGILGGIDRIHPTAKRIMTIQRGLARHGLSFHAEWCQTGDFSIDFGKRALAKVMQGPDTPTALICLNDLVAIGAINAATKKGIRVPQDLSIAGIDNIYLTQYITPEVTTVDLQSASLGQMGVTALIDLLNNKAIPERTCLDTYLVKRNSCAPPKPKHESILPS